MTWLLIVIEVLIALTTVHLLQKVAFYQRQSGLVRTLIAGVVLFVLFTLVRFLLPGVSAL